MIDNTTLGVCQRREHKAQQGQPSLWDPKHPKDQKHKGAPANAWIDRHYKARLLCHTCPLLDACESYLSDCEKNNIHVAGVIAGRYCDVHYLGTPGSHRIRPRPEDQERQVTCRACGKLMWPQRNREQGFNHRIPYDNVQHVGEGLCETCYLTHSRKKRKTHAA